MRIIYLHQYFNRPTDPGSTRSYEMGRRLVAAGHEVHLITTDRHGGGGTKWFETDEAGIRVHWLPVPYANEMGFADRVRAFFRFALAAGRRAVDVGGDVILATSTPLTIAIPGMYARRRLKVPMVFEVRDLWPELPIAVGALRSPLTIGPARWLERAAYRSSAHIVALSPGMKEGVVEAGVDPERVSVIPNSCDLDLFRVPASAGEAVRARYEWLGDRPLVVYMGSFGRINGVDWLARLAGAVRPLNPEVRFAAIGSGAGYEALRQAAEEEGVLGETFHLLGRVPKLEAPGWLAAADVATSLFVDLPEMWANSANKFFDGLASGTPVAINYGGWQADLVRETGAGLVLPVGDPAAAARQLTDFLADPDARARAGTAASRLAEERFDRDVLAERLREVLEAAGSAGGTA